MKKLFLALAVVYFITLSAWAQNAGQISPFVRLQFDDKVCHASQYTGTRPNDEGGKFAACVAALPSGGGTIDGRGLEGAQAWSACPWAGVTKSITVLLGSGTRSAAANCTVPPNVTLQFGAGAVLSPNPGVTLTINSVLEAPCNRQIFSGSGSIVLNAGDSVCGDWWGAIADGSTDSSSALNKAVTAIKGGGPKKFVLQPGTYKASSWDLTGAFGLTIEGTGSGSAYGADYKTRILYNGAGNTGVITIGPVTVGVELKNFEIDCNNRVPGSKGVWLTNAGRSGQTVQHVRGINLAITQCDYGWQVGDSSGLNNFNNNSCESCQFSYNNTGFQVETLNGEWASFDHTTFIHSYKYHAHATTQASFSCFRCYFGTMDPGEPVAGLLGQFRLFLDEFVSEIDQRVPTINVADAGGFVPGGHIRGSWFPTRGDANDYVIYWNSEAPLVIENTVLTGRVQWDSRKPAGRVFMIGSVIQPAYDAQTMADVADPKCLAPRLTGSYTDPADIDYYIRMYGSNTFRWRRGSPPTDSDPLYTIANRYKNPIEKGIIASFQIGCSYTSGSMWHFPVGKSGVHDIAGAKDNALRIKTSRNAAQALTNGSNVYRWDTVEEDLYTSYDTSTGAFTALFPGEYSIHAILKLPANASTLESISTFVNGLVHLSKDLPGNNAVDHSLEITDSIYLNQGDKLDIRVTQTSGRTINSIAGSSSNRMEAKLDPQITSFYR